MAKIDFLNYNMGTSNILCQKQHIKWVLKCVFHDAYEFKYENCKTPPKNVCPPFDFIQFLV